MTAYYPWQQTIWQQLFERYQQYQLPHALLFYGAEGLGKSDFAYEFAKMLLCEQPTQEKGACDRCRFCKLVNAGNHPDFFYVRPDEPGKTIKIDQIRELIQKADKTAQLSQRKVVVIDPADALNISASNALLKTLEEPTDNTVLLLVTAKLMGLTATIRSRCQKIAFHMPDINLTKSWLQQQNVQEETLPLLIQLADQAPLKVLSLIESDELSWRRDLFQNWLDFLLEKESIITISKIWSQQASPRLLSHLHSWVVDMICLKIDEKETLINYDFILPLQKLVDRFSLKSLFGFYDACVDTQRILSKNIALNPQLFVEKLLLMFREPHVS